MVRKFERAAPKPLLKKLAPPKPKPPVAKKPKPAVVRDELSTGRGSALRQRGLRASGAELRAPSLAVQGKSMRLNELLAANKTGGASSLRTEQLGDGKANCLENAVNLAQPGDDVVLLTDSQDPVGHAVVQRRDGTVVDPNRPGQPYDSLDAFQTQNPRYGNPAIVSDTQAEQILRTPPGRERDALITAAGLDGVASRQVADPGHVTIEYAERAQEEAGQVQNAYDTVIENGGSELEAANAAAEELNRLAQAATDPTYVARLTEAAGPTIEQIATVVGQAARDEGDRDKDLVKDTLRTLADVAQKGGATTANAIAGPLAEALPDDRELEEVDDAFFDRIADGGDSQLARSLHQALLTAGKTDAASGFADNEHGDDLEKVAVNEARAALDGGASADDVARQYGEYITTLVADSVRTGEDGDSNAAVQLLADLSDAGGTELATELATQLAEKLPDESDLQKLDDALHGRAEDGQGVTFSVQLASALAAAGKTKAAAELTDVVTTGIDALRSDFEDAQNEVDDLNQQLAQYVGSFGGLLTQEQQEAAIADFRERHAEQYERLETTATAFSNNIDAITTAADPNGPLAGLPEAAAIAEAGQRAVVNVVPRLGATQAGAEVVADAMEAQGNGETTFLDVVSNLDLTDEEVKALASDEVEALGVDSFVGFQQGIAETSFQAAALRIATRPEQSEKLIQGLLNNSEALGVPRAQLQAVLDDVQALATTTDATQRAEIEARIRTNSEELGLLDASSRAGQAFRGFATVLGALALGNGVANWSDASNVERIQTIAGALDTGIGAYELVLGVTGRAAAISSVATKASVGLAGLGAVLEGISAVDSFRNGDYVAGTGHSLTAIGSGVLAVAAVSNVVPVAGQIAAGVLIAVGFGLSLWANSNEANKNEGPTQDFLEGAGLSSKLAEELSNHTGKGFPAGPALVAVAERVGVTGPELITFLEGKSESELQNLIENAVHQVELEGDDDDRAFPETGDDADRLRTYYGNTNNGRVQEPTPDSIEGLALWMEHHGFLPPGATV